MAANDERTAKVTFDLPEVLLTALRQKATEEERTISAELRLLIRRHVAHGHSPHPGDAMAA